MSQTPIIELSHSRELTATECAEKAAEARRDLQAWARNSRMRQHIGREIAAWDRLAMERSS